MPVNFIQPSFAAGEVAPSLYARVDLDKYHQGAKLLRNFFIWPQGGASNRAGTMFVGRAKNSLNDVQLIPFQFNLLQAYVLEFGHQYMRVIMNGGYVLEPVFTISAITNANPGVITTSAPHGYNNGDQVYIDDTQTALDSTPGRQYLVQNATSTTFTLTDLDGNAINTTSYGAYSNGAGTVARIYTLVTPYQGSDVAGIKWTQSNDVLTLCHQGYPPMDLSRTEHWAWTLTQISFAPKISAPTGLSVNHNAGTNSPTGQEFWYGYVVTAVSLSPPEQSFASAPVSVQACLLDSDTGSENVISWTKQTAADLYYVYKANPQTGAIQSGAMYGYIGQTKSTKFTDTQIAPDFSQAPPTGLDPFNAGPIATVSVLNGGSGYDADTSLYVSDSQGEGAVLTPTVTNGVITAVTIQDGGKNYVNPVVLAGNSGTGASAQINVQPATLVGGVLTMPVVTATVISGGQNYFGKVTCHPHSGQGSGCTFTPIITNGVITGIRVTGTPSGYLDGDPLDFVQKGGSGAQFSASIDPSGNYPSCCCYFQQRKVFAGSLNSPQTLWMTQPGDYNNMNVSNPSLASDAIIMTIAAQQVNAIQNLVPMNDLLIFTSGGVWRILTGYITQPQPVTPTNTVVIPQTYIGAADLPPIVVNYDILYVQSKGSIVRDLAYNFWMNVYTGTDMSVLANHLFFGHNMTRWAYAEQPWYQIWTVRDDGALLSFTYLKEQNVYAWAHHDSPGNSGADTFLSVATIPEQQVETVNVDSVYFVIQRTIPGVNNGQPVKYIERMDSRNMGTLGASDVTKAWFLDCALQNYSGAPVQTITGLDHLNGASVSILADGNVQPQQTVVNGSVTLQYPASVATVGLSYTSQLQTLSMSPQGMAMQVQDYRKKITAVLLRVEDTRGLKVGPDFNTLTEIKERSSKVPMGTAAPLCTGDQRVIIHSKYLIDDNICLQQDNPLPCTILGVIPEVCIGDSPG